MSATLSLSIDYDERYYEASYAPSISKTGVHRYNIHFTITGQ